MKAQDLFTVVNNNLITLLPEDQAKVNLLQSNSLYSNTWLVEVAPLQSVLQDGCLDINLPDKGTPLPALQTLLEAESPTVFIWEGEIDNGADQEHVIFNFTENGVFGLMSDQDDSYQLEAINPDYSLLIKIEKSQRVDTICDIPNVIGQAPPAVAT